MPPGGRGGEKEEEGVEDVDFDQERERGERRKDGVDHHGVKARKEDPACCAIPFQGKRKRKREGGPVPSWKGEGKPDSMSATHLRAVEGKKEGEEVCLSLLEGKERKRGVVPLCGGLSHNKNIILNREIRGGKKGKGRGIRPLRKGRHRRNHRGTFQPGKRKKGKGTRTVHPLLPGRKRGGRGVGNK